MLRASSRKLGTAVSVRGVVDPDETPVNVAEEEILLTFAEAFVKQDSQALMAARQQLEEKLGPGAVVDAAALTGNFERMNRIADACGIALGEMSKMFPDVIRELDIHNFGSATISG